MEQRFVVVTQRQIQDTAVVEFDTTGRMAMAGVVGYLAGVFGGGYLGAKLAEESCAEDNVEYSEGCEWSGLFGAILGGMAGSSVAIPTSIHLANGRKGNLPAELLVSVGLGALGTALIFGGGDGSGILVGVFGVPIAQIVWTIQQERRAAETSPK